MKTKRLAVLAMLIALNVVLSILTPVKIQNFKFTFEAFPILFAGLAFGPLAGFTVGCLGPFIYQLFFSGYGFTPTTILWILPHAVSGLVCGLLTKLFKGEKTIKIVLITIISSLIVTALNTLALYVDAKLYNYYSDALVFASIPIKILCGIILAIIYAILIPKLIKAVKIK